MRLLFLCILLWPTLSVGRDLDMEGNLPLFCYTPYNLFVAYVDGHLEIGTLGVATEIVGNEIDLICTNPLYDILDMNANASEPWVYGYNYCFIAGEDLKPNLPSSNCKLDPVRRLPPITPTAEQLRHRHYKWEELDDNEESGEDI